MAAIQLAFDHSNKLNEQIKSVNPVHQHLLDKVLITQATSSTSRCTTKETAANTKPTA